MYTPDKCIPTINVYHVNKNCMQTRTVCRREMYTYVNYMSRGGGVCLQELHDYEKLLFFFCLRNNVYLE